MLSSLFQSSSLPVLEQVMNIYVAGQVYTIASFVLILSGTLALNRRLYGHWSVLPLIAFPLLYNNVFLVGTIPEARGHGLARRLLLRALHGARATGATGEGAKRGCFPKASGVSLSPRSGRNERSEWRTARRAVDWRGGAAPFNLWSTYLNVAISAPRRQLSGLPD